MLVSTPSVTSDSSLGGSPGSSLGSSPGSSPGSDDDLVRTQEDARCMTAWISGDTSAFDALHTRYRDRLWRYVRRSVSDEEQARELYQDVWTKVIDKRTDWQSSGRFVGWLFAIARNRLIDHHRAQERAPSLSPDIDVDVDGGVELPGVDSIARPLSPERRAELAADADRIQWALNQLPLAQREAVLLHHVAGMTLDEIGATTGTKREAIKSRLRYGINRLRQTLGATHD